MSTVTTKIPAIPATTRIVPRSPSPFPSRKTEMHTPKRQRCARVSFASQNTIKYIETFTKEENENLWYEASEMVSFKESAITLIRKRLCDTKKNIISRNASILRHSNIERTNDKSKGLNCVVHDGRDSDEDEEDEDSIHGMEVYLPARQKYNKKFIQNVLEAYYVRCTGNDEDVAFLARRWSKKNLERANSTGTNDFYEAYLADCDVKPLPTVIQAAPTGE